MDQTETLKGELQPTSPRRWTIDVSDIRTIEVGNVSLEVSQRDIFELFTFYGDFQYIEMQRESEAISPSGFRDSHIAAVLTGSKLADLYMSITLIKN